MSMNSVISSRRRELGLTQEQVADYLGVTAPAVHKWEKGSTCPDVSLLPALARLLRTDLNTLFGFRENLSKQEISVFTAEAVKKVQKNGIDAGFAFAEAKIREYPGCAALLHQLTLALDGTMIMAGDQAARERYEEKLLDWYDRAAHGDDEETRNAACYMLAGKYLRQENYAKAQEMLDLLPERTAVNKSMLQSELLIQKGQAAEAARLIEKGLLQNIEEQQMLLLKLVSAELAAGESECAAQIAGISAETAQVLGLWKYNSYVAPMQTAVAGKDTAESIRLFRCLLDSLFSPWDMQASPLFCRIAQKAASSAGTFEKMLPPLLADLETNPDYDFMRDNREFQTMIEEYRRKLPESAKKTV